MLAVHAPATQLNPAVKKIAEEVSGDRVGAIVKRPGDFGGRYAAADSGAPGIGRAPKWIANEFQEP